MYVTSYYDEDKNAIRTKVFYNYSTPSLVMDHQHIGEMQSTFHSCVIVMLASVIPNITLIPSLNLCNMAGIQISLLNVLKSEKNK